MIYYYAIINILTFMVFAFDKKLAIHHRQRISESTLFLFIFIGGALGSYLSMWIFHHKTRKVKFHIWIIFCFIIHISILNFYI